MIMFSPTKSADPHRLLPRQRVIFPHGNAWRQIKGSDLLQAGADADRITDQDIDFAAQKGFFELVGIRDCNFKSDIGMLLPKSQQKGGEKLARHGFIDADPDGSTMRTMERVNLGSSGRELVHRFLDAIQQGLARRRQCQPRPSTRKKLEPEFLFQKLNLPAYGGGSDMNFLRRQAKRPVTRDFVEISQRGRIHEVGQETERHAAPGQPMALLFPASTFGRA